MSNDHPYVPMEALYALYQKLSIIHIIEIDSYDEHDQQDLYYQLTASHPDLGLLTIKQGRYNCSMLSTYDFDFDELVIDPPNQCSTTFPASKLKCSSTQSRILEAVLTL
jgi:hypothetical protein